MNIFLTILRAPIIVLGVIFLGAVALLSLIPLAYGVFKGKITPENFAPNYRIGNKIFYV